ncbi:hypothetical protein LR48_Vigan01g324200 [Vigna angularis]|uniref:Uncharacterized protein n=1 Tax=Phaseolus angularis TaxID=3914 RepID=A0A0L9TT61_PHAAN|nr:hypothetical protein LR48_Vigan01g324200 [Vigna angularis]
MGNPGNTRVSLSWLCCVSEYSIIFSNNGTVFSLLLANPNKVDFEESNYDLFCVVGAIPYSVQQAPSGLEQARKALEGALSGKKNEFDKWDKEIKRREELGGGGDSGGGGWFGWGGRFGDDNFWQEAKQAGLTILALVLVYLLVAKGDLFLAIILNPLLYTLRVVRNGFSFVTSKVLKNTSTSNQADFDGLSKKKSYQQTSAKENVVRKWGSD